MTSVYMLPPPPHHHHQNKPCPRSHDTSLEQSHRSTMRGLRKLESSHSLLGQHAKGVGGLERAVDAGLNLIPFKGDVVTISPQDYAPSGMPVQRIIFLNITNKCG